jgi:DNA-3-methyladenine glycosylase II
MMSWLVSKALKRLATRPMQVNADNLHILVAELSALCPKMRAVAENSPLPPLRLREGGFLGLLRIIVFQQISIAAGNAIWARFEGALPHPTPLSLFETADETLQSAGLSRPKIRTMKALAHALLEGRVTQAHLKGENTAQLLTVKGIGPWTVEIYELSCLGLADVWPAGDIALQEAIKDIFNLETRPNAKEANEIAQRWQPFRAIAARLLWQHYMQQKQRLKEMIP